MAKQFNNNRNNNNNNRPQNNFFTKQQQKHGDDFMKMMTARDIQNGACQIFREIGRGRIDINKFGQYFLDPQFLECLIVEALANLNAHALNYRALNWYISNNFESQDIQFQTMILDNHKKATQAYEIIFNNLSSIKATGDIHYLFTMANCLKNVRNNI